MNHGPEVSVITPVFNGARYIGHAVRSVLDQHFQDFELVVVDNKSGDGTIEEVLGFTDPRIRLYREESHVSIYENFNRAASYARGNYLKFLCADDELTPTNLGTLLSILKGNPSVKLATSSRLLIDRLGNQLGVKQFHKQHGMIRGRAALRYVAEYGNFIGEPSTTLLRKADFVTHGGFSVQYHQVGDLDLWCRLLAEGDLYYLPAPLSRFRHHSAQLTAAHKYKPKIWILDEIHLSRQISHLFIRFKSSSVDQRCIQRLFAARLLRTILLTYAGSPIQFTLSVTYLIAHLPARSILSGVYENFRKLVLFIFFSISRRISSVFDGGRSCR
jgi:glycosyltransferase involved in cell wall biosynthesis